MSRRLPLMRKTPFVLDPRPLAEATSAHAGLLSVSRAFRSLGLPGMIEANLPLRQRQRGFSEAQLIESLVMLQVAGGECAEDLGLLNAKSGYSKSVLPAYHRCCAQRIAIKFHRGLKTAGVLENLFLRVKPHYLTCVYKYLQITTLAVASTVQIYQLPIQIWEVFSSYFGERYPA
jgi:hypothetical protein